MTDHRKIACGLFHSACVGHVGTPDGSRGDGGGRRLSVSSALQQEAAAAEHGGCATWGRNSYNVLGIGGVGAEVCVPTQVSGRWCERGEVLEVACGTYHTLMLSRPDYQRGKASKEMASGPTKFRLPSKASTMSRQTSGSSEDQNKKRRNSIQKTISSRKGGHIYAFGLGARGRLGIHRPDEVGIEDTWFTDRDAQCIDFADVYRVGNGQDDVGDRKEVSYYRTMSLEEKDLSAEAYGAIVHGEPAGADWLSVGDRYMPIISGGKQLLFRTDVEVLRICCGADHSLALATTGELYAWGMNIDGQCGTGGHSDVLEPTRVAFPRGQDMRDCKFAAGARHSLCTTAWGRLYAWGNNRQGRLGIGIEPETMAVPTQVNAMVASDVSVVACGEAHSGAIDRESKVWMWGAGSHGRLGLGELTDMPTPQMVQVFVDVSISQLALGGSHSVAYSGVTPARLFTWGSGDGLGQFAAGADTCVMIPQQVNFAYGNVDWMDVVSRIAQIACGANHTLLLLTDGALFAFGMGQSGQLGTGKSMKNCCYPTFLKNICGHVVSKRGESTKESGQQSADQNGVDVQKPAPSGLCRVCAGGMHSAALTESGHVYVWGSALHGQLGLGKDIEDMWEPRRVRGIFTSCTIVELSTGYDHCLAVSSCGSLFAWGAGESGRLGNGRTEDVFEPIPVMGSLHGEDEFVLRCSAGEEHSAAICRSDEGHHLFTWGGPQMGKLGIGSDQAVSQVTTPTEVTAWSSSRGTDDPRNPVYVSCGPYHTAVIVSLGSSPGGKIRGELWTFGGGYCVRLGLESQSDNQYVPKRVKVSEPFISVSCGVYHTAAITTDVLKGDSSEGDLWLWGRGKSICEIMDQPTPKKFKAEGIRKVKLIACNLHTLVVTAQNDIFTWGDNTHCQLGFLTSTRNKDHTKHEFVEGIPGAVQLVAAGPAHSLAVLASGAVYGWGRQTCGRLGLKDPLEKRQHQTVEKPSQVKEEWKSLAAICSSAEEDPRRAEHEDQDDQQGKNRNRQWAQSGDVGGRMLAALREGEKVTSFATLQLLLKNERPECMECSLLDREKEICDQLNRLTTDIQKIPALERNLSALQDDIGQSVLTNWKRLRQKNSRDVVLTGNPHMVRRLRSYEQLMWVLQTQPCYMASLSMCVADDEVGVNTFRNVCKCLYAAFDVKQIRHLFFALLRVMIIKEVEQENTLKKVFRKESSRAFLMFSEFILHPALHVHILHPIVQSQQGRLALVPCIAELTQRKDFRIYINFRDYRKEVDPSGEKDTREMSFDFAGHVEKFQNFLQKDFLESITQLTFEANFVSLAVSSLHTIKCRRFAANTTDDRVAEQELWNCEPLIYLFVMGILVPILEHPGDYTGAKVGLSEKTRKAVLDPFVIRNLRLLAEFLKMMVGSIENNADKELRQSASTLKDELLKMALVWAYKQDDLLTQLMVDCYAAHFLREPLIVSVPSADLARLSNLLLRYSSKVRLSEVDIVDQLCNKIGQWTEEDIAELSRPENNVIYNFTIDTRWLFKEKAMATCRTSLCPVPPRLCVAGASTVQTKPIKSYVIDVSYKPHMVIEGIFREISTLNATSFPELEKELESIANDVSLRKHPPDYGLAKRLMDGVEKIEELTKVEATLADFLMEMAGRIDERARHRQYLDQLAENITIMDQLKKKHKQEIADAENELKGVLKFSLDLEHRLHPTLSAAAARSHKKLKFETLKDSGHSYIKGVSWAPSATYTLKALRKEGVIIEMLEPYNFPRIAKYMSFQFYVTNVTGVDITVVVRKGRKYTTVANIKIEEHMLSEIRRADANDRISLPIDAPAVMFHSRNLADRISKLSTGR